MYQNKSLEGKKNNTGNIVWSKGFATNKIFNLLYMCVFAYKMCFKKRGGFCSCINNLVYSSFISCLDVFLKSIFCILLLHG